MTQAIAASEILADAGHELVHVVVGNHPDRALPTFFVDTVGAPVTMVSSPGFVFEKDRGVDLLGTLGAGIRHLPDWLRGLRTLRRTVDEIRPDLVLNFFEPLVGVLQATRPLPVPVLSAAHQFALLDNEAARTIGREPAPAWLRGFIRLVGFRSTLLALSFTPDSAPAASHRRVIVAPPLLRRAVLRLEPEAGDYVLVYVATHGYAESVRAWCEQRPEVRIHCFCDRPGAPTVEDVGPGLTLHQLDGEKFLRFMAGCRAVMCTAGFESICEAAFLGKAVLMVPLDNHHEQRLNASDGEAAGVAVAHPVFDLDALSRLPDEVDNAWFRAWCLGAGSRLLAAVERVRDGQPRSLGDEPRAVGEGALAQSVESGGPRRA